MEDKLEKLKGRFVLMILGATKLVASNQSSIPGKWKNLADSICVSCQTVHLKLIEADEQAAKDYYNIEENIKRRIGKEKFYSKEDLDMAQKRVEKVEF